MSPRSRRVHKETLTTVGTGLIVNYPLNLLGLYICIDLLEWTNSFMIGTTVTAWMTIVAYCRVFLIRNYYDKRT